MTALRAPFPWFGGKRRIADMVWHRFGEVSNYVEPFAGSLAVLLGRPTPFHGTETVNDLDGFICNFWRSLQRDPDGVAAHADWPVNENDLHARHAWLVSQRDTLTCRLEGDPDFSDVKIAGWWVWGICCWIGSGWCAGNGPWQVNEDRQLVHLGDAGRGVNRQLVHLGNAGRGVNRKRVHLGNAGMGVNRQLDLVSWMRALSDRLRHVRVCCGDWARVCGPTPTVKLGTTAVYLDPPYSGVDRADDVYAVDDSTVADAVRVWAIERGGDPRLRIALCGYDGHYEMPTGWTNVRWKAHGGYGVQGSGQGRVNASREIVWFSPHCVTSRQAELWNDPNHEATA